MPSLALTLIILGPVILVRSLIIMLLGLSLLSLANRTLPTQVRPLVASEALRTMSMDLIPTLLSDQSIYVLMLVGDIDRYIIYMVFCAIASAVHI
jgi:hypothetical protein